MQDNVDSFFGPGNVVWSTRSQFRVCVYNPGAFCVVNLHKKKFLGTEGPLHPQMQAFNSQLTNAFCNFSGKICTSCLWCRLHEFIHAHVPFNFLSDVNSTKTAQTAERFHAVKLTNSPHHFNIYIIKLIHITRPWESKCSRNLAISGFSLAVTQHEIITGQIEQLFREKGK